MTFLLSLLGCGDPLFAPPVSAWAGCLHDGWGIRIEPADLVGYRMDTVPDEKTHLSLHAAWDLLPIMTGRTTAGLYLDLPRPLEAGYLGSLEGLQGMYVEGHSIEAFRSRHLSGTIEVLALDQGRATIRVDVHATHPDSGEGEQWVQGIVDLPITQAER